MRYTALLQCFKQLTVGSIHTHNYFVFYDVMLLKIAFIEKSLFVCARFLYGTIVLKFMIQKGFHPENRMRAFYTGVRTKQGGYDETKFRTLESIFSNMTTFKAELSQMLKAAGIALTKSQEAALVRVPVFLRVILRKTDFLIKSWQKKQNFDEFFDFS